MANYVNNTNLWSSSLTKDVLTPYGEGLACDQFDQRIYYNVHRNDQYLWWVLNKKAGCPSADNMNDECSKVRFDRVRIVTIDVNEYMSCSCGHVQRFLLPCRHICAVLGYIEYYEPSLFHIRWHKDFNYYHGNSFSRNIARNTDTALRELLVYTRANHYTQSGKYKGIPMMDSEFMKDLPPFSMSDLTSDDVETNAVKNLMSNIIHATERNGYVLKNQLPLYPAAPIHREMSDSNIINDTEANNVFLDDCVDEFGGLSQTDTHMSTERLAFGNVEKPDVLPRSDYYKRALPIFEDMINTCQSEMQLQKAIHVMKGQHYHNVASNGQQNNHVRETYVFGQNDTQLKKVPRRKFLHETLRKN